MNNSIHFDFFIHKNMEEITQDQYDKFLDAFVDFVESKGYWMVGSSELTIKE